MDQLLIISGPVGVGKTTVVSELSELLEAQGCPHAFVDLGGQTYSFARPTGDPYGYALAAQNLAAVWQNAKAQGSRN